MTETAPNTAALMPRIREICKIVSLLNRKDLLTLEIGSRRGYSTEGLAMYSRKVVCVDWWRGMTTGINPTYFDEVPESAYLVFRERLKNVWDKIIPIVGDHLDTLPLLGDRIFDVIFIDGDHKYSGISFDIEQAKRLIKPGGLIFGHDYRISQPPLPIREFIEHKEEIIYKNNHCGVVLAVQEAFKDFDVYGDVGYSHWRAKC